MKEGDVRGSDGLSHLRLWRSLVCLDEGYSLSTATGPFLSIQGHDPNLPVKDSMPFGAMPPYPPSNPDTGTSTSQPGTELFGLASGGEGNPPDPDPSPVEDPDS